MGTVINIDEILKSPSFEKCKLEVLYVLGGERDSFGITNTQSPWDYLLSIAYKSSNKVLAEEHFRNATIEIFDIWNACEAVENITRLNYLLDLSFQTVPESKFYEKYMRHLNYLNLLFLDPNEPNGIITSERAELKFSKEVDYVFLKEYYFAIYHKIYSKIFKVRASFIEQPEKRFWEFEKLFSYHIRVFNPLNIFGIIWIMYHHNFNLGSEKIEVVEKINNVDKLFSDRLIRAINYSIYKEEFNKSAGEKLKKEIIIKFIKSMATLTIEEKMAEDLEHHQRTGHQRISDWSKSLN